MVCLFSIARVASQLFQRVEKYRPLVLDDVVGNQETIERLKVIAKDGNCPHLIISVSHWYCIFYLLLIRV